MRKAGWQFNFNKTHFNKINKYYRLKFYQNVIKK